MKYLRAPTFWIFFGLIVFPLLCHFTEVMAVFAIERLEIESEFFVPTVYAGWGAKAGVLLGIPLGMVSALCTQNWRNGRFVQSRFLALLGGGLIGGTWLVWVLRSMELDGLVGEFGYITPALLWAICLLIFAFLARVQQFDT